MVDDHHVGGRGALPHPRHEAVVESRALGAEAGLRRRRDLVPEGKIFGQILELGAIAGLGPADHSRMIGRKTSCAAGTLTAPSVSVTELVQAEVVRAPLHVGRGERDAERLAQRRNVLEEDLFLEVLGAGRDEDALAAQDRRNEIRERLAGAGAGLREEDPAFLEYRRDGRRHLDLTGASLEVGHGRGPARRRGRARKIRLGDGRPTRKLVRIERELPDRTRPRREPSPRAWSSSGSAGRGQTARR